MNKKDIIYVLVFVAMVLQVVSISTEEWSTKSLSGNLKQKMGLWKSCSGKSRVSLPIVTDPTFPKNALNAARVFAVMGAVANFMALSCMYDYPAKVQCHLRLLVLAGACSLAAMIVWVTNFAKLNKVKYDLGYSFHFSWVAGALSLFSAVYMYYGK